MATHRAAPILLVLFCLGIGGFVCAIQYSSPMTNIITRWPGGHSSIVYREAGKKCNASDPGSWGYLDCTRLIDCVYNDLSEIQKSDIAVGSTIVGLLPTILIFAAVRPNELVSQALISPHRALATAAFSIGIPATIFSQLKPIRWRPKRREEDLLRVWIIPLSSMTPGSSHRHLFVKLLADAAIFGMSFVMLWQTYELNNTVLIQWKCETPIMVFCWPLSCIFWMVLAILILCTMVDEIRFEHALTKIPYTWPQVVLLPYTLNMRLEQGYQWRDLASLIIPTMWKRHEPPVSHTATGIDPAGPTLPARSNPVQMLQAASEHSVDEWCIRVTVRMPRDGMLATWQVYDFLVDFLGIAIYFYSTFVLLSVLFLGSVRSLKFTSMVAGIYVAVRVIGTVL